MRSLLLLAVFVACSIGVGFWVIHAPWLLFPLGIVAVLFMYLLSTTWKDDRD